MDKIVLALLLFLCSCSNESKNVLNIAGSDSILELVQLQAEEFFKQKKIPVNCTGGGSGVGIRLVSGHDLDIANSSRELTKMEATPDLVAIPIARDLITVIVHKNNPVRHLSVESLRDIYTGKITHWDQVGGFKRSISLYGRQSSSGTYQYFREVILKDADFSLNVKEMTGNSQIIRSLELDKDGIAYVSYGYFEPKQNTLHAVSLNGISPSIKNFDSKYALARNVYQIYSTKNTNINTIRMWFSFLFSQTGTNNVIKMGFLPIDTPTQKDLKQKIRAI